MNCSLRSLVSLLSTAASAECRAAQRRWCLSATEAFFLTLLPATFSRQEALRLGRYIGISQRTVDRYLGHLSAVGAVVKTPRQQSPVNNKTYSKFVSPSHHPEQ